MRGESNRHFPFQKISESFFILAYVQGKYFALNKIVADDKAFGLDKIFYGPHTY